MPRLSFYAVAATIIAAVTFFGAYRYAHTSATTNTITAHDADVNGDGAVTIADPIAALNHIGQLAPGARPVAEQNLDGNGNIKVHEQGTVNVNVLSTSVGPNGRTIDLGQVTAPGGRNYSSSFFPVDDCRSIIVTASFVAGDPGQNARV